MKTGANPPLLLALGLAALAAGGCNKLDRADRDFEAGRYDEAELEYRAVLQQSPRDPVAVRQLGILYFQEGRPGPAYYFLKGASELEPGNFDVQLKLALLQEIGGEDREARAAAKKLLENQPPSEDAVMLLVGTSHTKSERDETRSFIGQLRQKGKDYACYHLARGTLLLLDRDSASAEIEFRQAIALDPNSSSAHLELGNLLFSRRELKEAGEAYKGAAELSPLRSTRRLRYIDFQVRTGASAEAKRQLAELMAKAPDYIPAAVYAMKLAFSERRYDDCAEIAQGILARDSSNYDALVQSGTLKLAQKDVDGGVKALEQVEKDYPRSAEIKYQLGLAHLQKGETVQAENRLIEALQLAPNSVQAVLVLANLDIRKGDAAGAIGSVTRLLQAQPQLAEAYIVLAHAYQTNRNPEQAVAALRQAGQLSPKDPQVPYLIGMVLARQGKDAEAREAFEQSVALVPDFPPALEMLVYADLREKRFASATERVEALLKRFPTSAVPLLLRSQVRLAVQNLAGAESDLLSAIELDPKSETAYLLLAKFYLVSNKSQKALDDLESLADRTNSTVAMMQLGLLHARFKQFDASRSDYERLLKIDPTFTPALNNLACLYCDNLGQLAKAEQVAKQARVMEPDNGAIADTLGWIDFKKGDYADALALIQEAAEKNPADLEVQYHLGMAHYMLGDEEAARVALQQASSAPAGFPFRDDALQRIGWIGLDSAKSSDAIVRELKSHLAAESGDPVARVRLAFIQEREGDAKEAAANFEAVLKIKPQDTRIMAELAGLYAGRLGDPDRARELLKTAHALAPTDPGISALLGHILYKTGDFAWSADLLQDAARDLRGQPGLVYDLARAQYAAGQVTQAQATLAGVLQSNAIFPSRSEAEQFASLIAASKDPSRADAALSVARKRIESEPDCVPALMVIARAEEGRGDYAAAAGAYDKILAADPLFAPAIRQLAVLCARHLNDDQKAYQLAEEARAAFPADAELDKIVGIVAYRGGDYSAAARSFQAALLKRSEDGEALYYLGMCHYNLKESSASKSELERALSLTLSERQAAEAKRTLDLIRRPGR